MRVETGVGPGTTLDMRRIQISDIRPPLRTSRARGKLRHDDGLYLSQAQRAFIDSLLAQIVAQRIVFAHVGLPSMETFGEWSVDSERREARQNIFRQLFPLQAACSTNLVQQNLSRRVRTLMLLDQVVGPLEAGDYMLQC